MVHPEWKAADRKNGGLRYPASHFAATRGD